MASAGWKTRAWIRAARTAPLRLRILGGQHLQPRLFQTALFSRRCHPHPNERLRRHHLDEPGAGVHRKSRGETQTLLSLPAVPVAAQSVSAAAGVREYVRSGQHSTAQELEEGRKT